MMEETFGENVQLDEDSFEGETKKKSKCPNKKILFFIFKNEISIIFLLKQIFNMISISTMKLE